MTTPADEGAITPLSPLHHRHRHPQFPLLLATGAWRWGVIAQGGGGGCGGGLGRTASEALQGEDCFSVMIFD
nr:hypothetical protein Itr_chr14CG12500 [Ipomoea trifida]